MPLGHLGPAPLARKKSIASRQSDLATCGAAAIAGNGAAGTAGNVLGASSSLWPELCGLKMSQTQAFLDSICHDLFTIVYPVPQKISYHRTVFDQLDSAGFDGQMW